MGGTLIWDTLYFPPNIVLHYNFQTQCFQATLYFGNEKDHTDVDSISSDSKLLSFESSANTISPFTGSIDTGFSGIKTTINAKEIDLGITFTDGLADPEINKKTGEIIYIDNRPLIQRDSRQKEDVKIILEF